MVARPAVYQCLAEMIDDRFGSHTADEETLRIHSDLVEQPVTYGAATFCRACGDPAPCEPIRHLAERYGCDVVG